MRFPTSIRLVLASRRLCVRPNHRKSLTVCAMVPGGWFPFQLAPAPSFMPCTSLSTSTATRTTEQNSLNASGAARRGAQARMSEKISNADGGNFRGRFRLMRSSCGVNSNEKKGMSFEMGRDRRTFSNCVHGPRVACS